MITSTGLFITHPRFLRAAAALAILGLIAIIYWPVTHAGLVWDDKLAFRDAAWLKGDNWLQSVLHGVSGHGWINYFRPLVVALFAFEGRAFDLAPGAMHAISLCIHLSNSLLVGWLAYSISPKSPQHWSFIGLCMLLYGLHPALIEPVAWISCQADLLVTLLILLGLCLNAKISNSLTRATTVGSCFFLAACAKESAIAMPLFVVILDGVATWQGFAQRFRLSDLKSIWTRQRYVYLSLFVAGLAYLAVRLWALGFLVKPIRTEFLLSFARLQEACFTYLTYWRICLWPMVGLNPIHAVDETRFTAPSASSLAIDAAALAIVFLGFYLFSKRKPLGACVLALTAALLPVLHIIPLAFVESAYHERYVMTGLAVACALIPLIWLDLIPPTKMRHLNGRIAVIGVVVWLGLAVLNIRVTVPLWSDEITLWQWALRQDPASVVAKDHLLTTYLEQNDLVHAHELADALLADNTQCPNCLLNAAYEALAEHDDARASAVLERLKTQALLAYDPRLLHGFILASGELLELQNNASDAEDAYHDAIKTDPLDPAPYMDLALLLARRGDVTEARKEAEAAFSLYEPDERDERRRTFEQVLAASASAMPAPTSP